MLYSDFTETGVARENHSQVCSGANERIECVFKFLFDSVPTLAPLQVCRGLDSLCPANVVLAESVSAVDGIQGNCLYAAVFHSRVDVALDLQPGVFNVPYRNLLFYLLGEWGNPYLTNGQVATKGLGNDQE